MLLGGQGISAAPEDFMGVVSGVVHSEGGTNVVARGDVAVCCRVHAECPLRMGFTGSQCHSYHILMVAAAKVAPNLLPWIPDLVQETAQETALPDDWEHCVILLLEKMQSADLGLLPWNPVSVQETAPEMALPDEWEHLVILLVEKMQNAAMGLRQLCPGLGERPRILRCSRMLWLPWEKVFHLPPEHYLPDPARDLASHPHSSVQRAQLARSL